MTSVIKIAKNPDNLPEIHSDAFRLLVEGNTDQGLFLLDSQGRIVSWNTGATQLTGYSTADVLGNLFPGRFIGQDLPSGERPFDAWLTNTSCPWVARRHLTRKDGQMVFVEIAIYRLCSVTPHLGFGVRVKPIPRPSRSGKPDMDDSSVNENRPDEQALRRQQEQLQGLADNLPDGAIYQIEISPTGERIVTYVSASIERLLGVTHAEALADPYLAFSLIVPEDLARVQQEEAEAIASQTQLNCEFRSYTRRGEIKWLHARSTPRRAAGGATIWDGIVVDITERKLAYDALRRGQTVLGQAGKLAQLGAWGVELQTLEDLNANPLWWSEETYRIFGFEAGSITPTNELFFNLIHPEDRKRVSEAVQLALSTSDNYEIDHRILRANDGQTRVLVEHAEIVRDVQGNPLRMIGAVKDITDHHRATTALRRSEASLIEAQRLAGLGSWEWDRATDVVVWSEEMYHIFGRDLQSPALNYNEAKQHYSTEAWLALADASANTLKTGNPYDLDCEIRRPNGVRRWIVTRGEAIRDNSGKIVGLRGTAQDITERKQSERLRLAVMGADIGTWHWDILSGDLRWSDRCKQIFGVPLDEAMSHKRFLQALHPDDRERADSAIKIALESRTDYGIEFRSVWPDGSVHWAVAKGRGYYDESGRALRMEGAALDITAQKNSEKEISILNAALKRRAQQVEEANKELEAFSYSVSHDLRAPLRAIDGFSRIVLDDFSAELSPDALEFLRDIRANTQQMGRLVDDLLKFSHVGREDLIKREVKTLRLVEECLEELRPHWPVQEWEIQIGDLPACEGDQALLKQVWLNLLSNAFKYSSKRTSPRIEIGSHSAHEENTFFVRDNGTGFDMRYAHKLFGVFQRLHRAEEFEGTGVGLAIVQRILHRHGGRVWAESTPGQGASFSFTLPVRDEIA